MAFASSGGARLLLVAIGASLAGIALLLVFIIGRRWVRARYFARRDTLAAYFRQHWNQIVDGTLVNIAPSGTLAWTVLEAILLDRLEVARGDEVIALTECLRRTGMLDRRLVEARVKDGWKRHAALVVLGRTRAPEVVPALAEALDSADLETRIAAARGLGKVASPHAAVPILDRIVQERLDIPWGILKNALLTCCAHEPAVLSRYLRTAAGNTRELLARVLSEVADSSTADELLAMVGDPSAELRASAARGLGHLAPDVAIPPLAQLASDDAWFVRLRAAVSLGGFVDQGANAILVRILCDRHRLVRQRAAWALIRSHQLVPTVVRDIVHAGDNYGLQAVVSELDRSGMFDGVLRQVGARAGDAGRLVTALEGARARLATEAQPEVEPRKEPVVA